MRAPVHAATRAVLLAAALAACGDNAGPEVPVGLSQHEAGNCFIGGCSMETCTADGPTPSPCIYVAAYACYRDATCEPQPDGACGWTPTDELTSCLAQFPPPP
jgi:hypothetical protein